MMLLFTQFKSYIYGVLLSAIAIGAFVMIQNWHYRPLSTLRQQVATLTTTVTRLETKLNVCDANLSKQKLQGFIDGVGEGYEEDEEGIWGGTNYEDKNISIDFTNATY